MARKGLTYLNRKGEVVNKTLKEIGTTWEKMHEAHTDFVTKEEANYLKKYGLKTTVFNVANLRKYGFVHLPKHFVGVALKHGAKDKRKLKKVM